MRKIVLSALMLVLALGLSGCFGGGEKSQSQEVSSLEEAKKSGQKMACIMSIKDSDGSSFETRYYVDGEKYKSESEFDGKFSYTLYDGSAFYTWTDGEKEGLKMDEKCMDEMSEDTEDYDPQVYEDIQDTFMTDDGWDSSYDIKCSVDDKFDLVAPSEVNFSDYCQMIKDSMDMFSNLGDGMFEGWE